MKIESSFYKILLLFTGLLIPMYASSDEVVMKNGDRLSGKIILKSGDKLVLQTSYAGEIEIRWMDVDQLTTDRPVRIILDDKTKLKGILSGVDDTGLSIAVDTNSGPEPVPMERIVAINPPEISDFRSAGQVNLGIERDRGNSDEDNYHLDAELRLRWPDDRLTLSFDGDIEESNSTKTKQKADIAGDYDHFLTEKWYFTTGAFFEHDKFADLNLRTTIGAGPGYQFLETDRTNLSVEAGPGYVWENFDDSKDNDYPVALWKLRFDHFVFESFKLQAFHNHSFRQSLRTSSDYLFRSKTGLRIPVFDQLQVTLQYNYDRDNAPGDDAKKNDHEYLFTAGYKW